MSDAFLLALDNRRLARERERMAIMKRMSELNAEGEEDTVAKRVYLEMVKAGQFSATDAVVETMASPAPDSVESAPAPAGAAAVSVDVPMVKDMILMVLRDAGQAGLTAAQIKGKAFLRFKKHINPNTLTVTLGRYSKPKDGEPRRARCEGRVWYYVRGDEPDKVRSLELALINGGRSAAE